MPVSQRLRDSDRDPHGDAEQLNDRQTMRAEVGAGGGGEGGPRITSDCLLFFFYSSCTAARDGSWNSVSISMRPTLL